MIIKERLWAVIPAAGVGKRMQSSVPKQYLDLNGRTVIEHTLDCFTTHPAFSGIVVVVSPGDEYWQDLTAENNSLIASTAGGKERCDSVLNGLLELTCQGAAENDWVLVHDAARPCLSRKDMDRLIATCTGQDKGGILAMPVRDTMKRQNTDGAIAHTEDRDGLWHALTPQMFRLRALQQALSDALANGAQVTDEASAMELAGNRPLLVEGAASNIKITRPDDLALAGFFLSQKEHGDG